MIDSSLQAAACRPSLAGAAAQGTHCGQGVHGAGASLPGQAAQAQAFEQAMNAASARLQALNPAADGTASVQRPAADGPLSAVARQSSMLDSVFARLDARYGRLQHEALDLGHGFDVTRPESAVLAFERQVKLSTALLEYQCIVQGADNVKHAIKSLTQLQG